MFDSDRVSVSEGGKVLGLEGGAGHAALGVCTAPLTCVRKEGTQHILRLFYQN